MKKEKKPCRAKAENIRGKIMMLGMICLFFSFFPDRVLDAHIQIVRACRETEKIRRYVSGLEREKEHERQSDAVDQALPQAPQRSLDRGTGRAYKKGRVCHTLPRGARPPRISVSQC